jgi:O-acetylserine/cysteine efflux transporter
MTPRDLAIGVVAMFVWGMNFVVGKLGIAELPPMLLMTLRYIITAAVLLPFVGVPHGRLRGILGVSFTYGLVHFALLFTAMRHIDGSVAAVVSQLQVPFAAMLAALVLKERIGWVRAGGMAVAFIGTGFIAGEPHTASAPWALAMAVGGALMWGLFSIQVKRIGAISPFQLNGWVAALAAPQMLVCSLVFETGQLDAIRNAGFAGWGAVLYMVFVITIFGYGIWYYLLQKYEVNQAMPLTLLSPVFGLAGGILLLGESAGPARLIGAALTIAGVAMIVLRPPAKP